MTYLTLTDCIGYGRFKDLPLRKVIDNHFKWFDKIVSFGSTSSFSNEVMDYYLTKKQNINAEYIKCAQEVCLFIKIHYNL
jgi:hypothetical protein